jgi:DnaK suppressor protein
LSKPTAKAAAAKTKAPAAKKPVAKPVVKSASKPAAKPAAKTAATPKPNKAADTKAAAKAAAKPTVKPAAKSAPPVAAKLPAAPLAAAHKIATKSAAQPVVKPALKTASTTTTPPAAAATPHSAPAKAAAPSSPAVAPAKPAPKSPGRRGSANIPVVQHTSPPSNRFTDRFAPARPSKAPDPIESQKSIYKADPKLVNAYKTKAGRDLTVPELLAMPDSEYMKDKQIDYFRACLQIQKDDLLSNAGQTTEHLREDTTIVPDPADRATIEEEHAIELRARDRERKLLKKIAQSLTRLDSGEYGFCDETGEPIGLARLLARPTATLSLEAQQRREMKQKMFGD